MSSSLGHTAYGKVNGFFMSSSRNVTCPERLSRVVQLEDQMDGGQKCVFPDVCLTKSARTGEGPHRGFLPGGRLGHTGARLL